MMSPVLSSWWLICWGWYPTISNLWILWLMEDDGYTDSGAWRSEEIYGNVKKGGRVTWCHEMENCNHLTGLEENAWSDLMHVHFSSEALLIGLRLSAERIGHVAFSAPDRQFIGKISAGPRLGRDAKLHWWDAGQFTNHMDFPDGWEQQQSQIFHFFSQGNRLFSVGENVEHRRHKWNKMYQPSMRDAQSL